MMNDLHDKTAIARKISKLREHFHVDRQALQKELADSLAEADRYFDYFHSNEHYEDSELKDIAEKVRLHATELESKHPKLSGLFREFSEILRNMGI